MKLSDLISYLNLLEQEDHTPEYAVTLRQLQSVALTVQRHNIQLNSFAEDLTHNINGVVSAFERAQATLDALKMQLREMIAELEPEQYAASDVLYEQEMIYDTSNSILNRRLAIDDDSNILLRSRLRNYGDWRLPGMIIRPGLDDFIEDMVPLDPLYVVDETPELINPAMQAFTPEYQRRLRPYTIDDRTNGQPLWQLPNNQFGLVFAYNYFNYKPVRVIDRYLGEIYNKLRPGGAFIFTFNDCDRGHGAALSERSFMCYTPGHAVARSAENIGYEILDRYHGQGDIAWFELKKPGTVQSIRGGQSLAKIIAT